MSKQTFIVGIDTDKVTFEEWIAEHDAKVRGKAIKDEKLEDLTITKMTEKLLEAFCDTRCKYSAGPIPEGKTDNWLFEEGSPCETCPLNYF